MPDPASGDLFGTTERNFQVFQPLDFLAELTQNIPNQGEHLVHYYGHYSNKTRGLRSKQVAAQDDPDAQAGGDEQNPPIITDPVRLDRRRWAMLIKRIYQADPLLCPKCGGTMKIIAFIEAHQVEVIHKILEHCGLWEDPLSRGPPGPGFGPRTVRSMPDADAGISYEVDTDFLEHAHRDQLGQPQLPWES